MKPWIERAALILALGAPLAFQLTQAKDESNPIVDVRIDEAYQQIPSSQGDQWAPTWGRNDVLYTGNDDGNNFGVVLSNAIAFGKLKGNDPDELKGTTVNGMGEYREQPFGPENAAWRTVEAYALEGVLHRFSPCGLESDGSAYSCLMSSSDGGKTWSKNSAPMFRGTKFSAPSFIMHRPRGLFLLGSNAADYVYAAAYAGSTDGDDVYLIGRALKSKLAAGNAADWSFQQENPDVWRATLDTAQPSFNSTGLGPDGGNWKTMNTYSVDGVLYMFVTRCSYPTSSTDAKRRHIFQNSSIIKSTDNGRTWTRSAQENLDKPMFPGKRFGTAYFVWYGKDGAARVDNADKYVYAVSNNGHFENGDDYVIGRVLRTKLPNLSAADWSFYKKGDGMQDGSWTSNLDEAQPMLSEPGKLGMTGMTYIEGLRRYVMASWHYNQENFFAGIRAKDLSTMVQFFEAPKPWGPWTKVKALQTGKLGWYTPIVGQRFQTVENSNAVKAFFYASGFFTKPEGGVDMSLYKLNYMPITLSTKPLQHKDPAFVGGRQTAAPAGPSE